MNSIEYVETLLEGLIQRGAEKADIVRSVGKACAGWPYVFGAWGEECTPAGRRKRKRDDHPTIVSKCQVLSGTKGSCDGCQWDLPVRMFDCRGFTSWLLKQAGITIQGGGCTSQWNTKTNWTVRGPISEMPRDRVCCVFVDNGGTKEHTGMYLGDGSTVECSSGVQYFEKMKGKWTHYAIPAGLYDSVPEPAPATDKPTLRKGASGVYVTLMQTSLISQGYDCGASGADGQFGKNTLAALMRYQKDHGLDPDGVCGPKTWAMLETSVTLPLYTVHIPGLPRYKAEAIISQYDGAWMEGGE